MEHRKNADRFHGYADVYERARPAVPPFPLDVIRRYLGREPGRVVDLGCGTGLSTRAWAGQCAEAIGVDPSCDMLAVARRKAAPNLRFVQAFSDDTGLEANSADVVICSQSFHWMEPTVTLREVDRLLKPGGVFATVDCDWPPVASWRLEQTYMQIYAAIKRLEGELTEIRSTFIRYGKENHLKNIKESGYFRYVREIAFANRETGDAGRWLDMILSQGNLQMILKKRPELIQPDLARFERETRSLAGDMPFPMDFSYRMRIGVK